MSKIIFDSGTVNNYQADTNMTRTDGLMKDILTTASSFAAEDKHQHEYFSFYH